MEPQTQDSDIDLSHLLDSLLRRRWIILAIAVIVFSASALVTMTTKPVYQASCMLIIEKERGAGAVYTNGSMVENKNDDYYQTQYKLLQSNSFSQKAYDAMKLDANPEFGQPHGVARLQRAITIAPVPRSRLVYIRAESMDPELAARMANTLGEVFVSENVSNQLFISREVLQSLQIRRDDPKAMIMYETLPTVVSNPLVQTLRSEYAKLESQHAELSQQVTPRHPSMIALQSNMTALKSRIATETEKVVMSLKTELSGQLKGNNVRIIDPAQVPEYPVRPQKTKALLMGLIAGLVLGILVAYTIDLLDQSIRTQEDVENKLHLPFLGAIPQGAPKESEVAYQSLKEIESSLTSESFRNMRTMVDFAGVTEKAKQLLVTSTLQAEGKSYVASNLAVTFAQHGESVLIIDGDLRRPKLHKNFQLSSRQGLSDFLAKGENVDELAGLIQDTDIKGLKLLACGPRPPNPSELLNTPRVAAALAWAKANFDRVIIDCTPMFPINDTLLWGRHIHSAIFVARYGKTRVPLMKAACQKLKAGDIQLLGAVINAARPGGLTYAGYSYYQQYYQEYTQKPEAAKIA